MTDQVELSDSQYKYDIADGAMYVTIKAAVEEECWEGGTRVKRALPRIMIRTSPSLGLLRDPAGLVRVRGRKYSTWNYVAANPVEWHKYWGQWDYRDAPGDGGYRNEAGAQMDRKSKARESLRALEAEVIARFEAEHPEWRRTSERLRLEGQFAKLLREADKARAEAAECEAEAAKVAESLGEYGVELTPRWSPVLTRDHLSNIVNGGADLVTDEFEPADSCSDLVNVVVNAIMTLADDPAATMRDVVERNYDCDLDEMRSWWDGWS